MGKGMGKALSIAVGAVVGAVAGAAGTGKVMKKKADELQNFSDKHLELFLMMDQWVKVKQEGKNLSSYFGKNGYKRIAIYGMSYAGETLVEELKGTDVEILYGIDKKSDSMYADMDIVSADDVLKEVDVIVVTAITYFNEIEEKLRKKVNCPIVSLEDILYEI